MKTFFNKLYYIYYVEQLGKESDPDVIPIVTISFCQCSNLLSFVIILFYFTNLKEYGVVFLIFSFFILLLVVTSMNFIYYKINQKGKEIVDNKYVVTYLFRSVAFIYRFVSFFMPVFLIYWFQNKI